MYAIVQVGGRQYRAAPGERLVVDRLEVEPGSRVHLSDVRMLIAEEGDEGETQIGRPRLDDVAVAARAVSHFRGPKILVFKFKPKKRYRRHRGFRAELTELRVEEVRLGAYQDAAAEPAKKCTSRAGAKDRDGGETTPKVTGKPAKPPAPSRRRAGAAATPEAPTTAAEVKPAPKSTPAPKAKPKAARTRRKPAASAPATAEKKKPGSAAKTRTKSENTDGS